jgi:hypothetical protein
MVLSIGLRVALKSYFHLINSVSSPYCMFSTLLSNGINNNIYLLIVYGPLHDKQDFGKKYPLMGYLTPFASFLGII